MVVVVMRVYDTALYTAAIVSGLKKMFLLCRF